MPNIQFQFRRDTSANWLLFDPVLASGEMGIETDTRLFKLGDGNTSWSVLSYGGIGGAPGPSGPTGPSGPSGPTGPAGANGQSSSYFNYRADDDAVPTTGHISWSNFASQISSTYIRVSHIEENGDDIDIFLNLVQQGNTLIIQDANVSANFQNWLVSGTPIPNTGSGYVEYPVTLTSSGGIANFAINHQIILATITPGPTGPTGPINTQGLQYILTGPSVNGIITNLPNTTVWTTLTWTLASTIAFKVPPNWTAGQYVSFDGLALYDFNINNVNYWSIYYTTTSQPTEQALLGAKNINNAIVNSSPQMYFPMNLLIPSTFLQVGGTINLRVYGFTNGTIVQFSQTPVINARVSITLD